jgi:hypothetical protein
MQFIPSQSLLGEDEVLNQHAVNIEMDMEEEEKDHEFAGLQVVEKKLGTYDCPEFILSEREESRIQKPWRQGLIVKLMGRRIGYKALETRLKQIWVRKGVISIIDLGYEYFLVYFTNEEDYTKALEDGPWLIYDHYLIAREWTPNFHPNNATIEKAAVWVRISGLPIEYYDAKILNYIGNRIGETVKVDRNTLFQERGKYARVCVEVDLNKPLLAMFELKGEVYKVEYEGLHMLCRSCGKFGHYVEGCPDKLVSNTSRTNTHQDSVSVNEKGQTANGKEKNEGEGPWVVVQKPRRPRKTKEGNNKEAMAAGSARNTGTGTRFDILETINEEHEIRGSMNEERISRDTSNIKYPNLSQEKGRGNNEKNVGDKKGKAAEKMGTREPRKQISMNLNIGGTQAVNNIQNNQGRKKGELTKGGNQGNNEVRQKGITNDHHEIIGHVPPNNNHEFNAVDNSHVGDHHTPRPPDAPQPGQTSNIILIGPNSQSEEPQAQKINEEDMEIVPETPSLDQEEGGAKSMNLA